MMASRLILNIPALTLAALLAHASAGAQQSPASAESPAAPRPRLIGLETGEPERNSYGMEGGGGPACRPVFSREARALGPQSGDAEKDSIGFEMLGQEGCPASPPP